MLPFLILLPRKPTCPLKNSGWNMKFLLKWPLFRKYVSEFTGPKTPKCSGLVSGNGTPVISGGSTGRLVKYYNLVSYHHASGQNGNSTHLPGPGFPHVSTEP